MAAGGIISLVKTLPLLFSTFYEAVKAARSGKEKSEKRTERDLDIRFVIGGIILFALFQHFRFRFPGHGLSFYLAFSLQPYLRAWSDWWAAATIRFPV